MYRQPAILRYGVPRQEKAQAPASPERPAEPPVAECLRLIRACRDSLLPLLDRSAQATRKELKILKDLRSERGDCAATLRARLAIDDGEMSRLTARLAAKGLLSRTKAAGSRKVALRLTPTGRALVDRSNWAEHCLLEARLETLTPTEHEALRSAVTVVADLLCGADRA